MATVGVKGLKWIIIYRRQNDVLETSRNEVEFFIARPSSATHSAILLQQSSVPSVCVSHSAMIKSKCFHCLFLIYRQKTGPKVDCTARFVCDSWCSWRTDLL